MEVFILYAFVAGLICASWVWDSKTPTWLIVINVFFAIAYGWFITPILIGRMIAQIIKNK